MVGTMMGNQDQRCRVCDGPWPADLVERIRTAGEPVGKPMTADQFADWLAGRMMR